MDIEEYRKQFIDELRFNAEHEGTEPEIACRIWPDG